MTLGSDGNVWFVCPVSSRSKKPHLRALAARDPERGAINKLARLTHETIGGDRHNVFPIKEVKR